MSRRVVVTGMGAVTPIARASVKESSTCVSGRTGPKIDAFNEDFAPTMVTFSSQAN